MASTAPLADCASSNRSVSSGNAPRLPSMRIAHPREVAVKDLQRRVRFSSRFPRWARWLAALARGRPRHVDEDFTIVTVKITRGDVECETIRMRLSGRRQGFMHQMDRCNGPKPHAKRRNGLAWSSTAHIPLGGSK